MKVKRNGITGELAGCGIADTLPFETPDTELEESNNSQPSDINMESGCDVMKRAGGVPEGGAGKELGTDELRDILLNSDNPPKLIQPRKGSDNSPTSKTN